MPSALADNRAYAVCADAIVTDLSHFFASMAADVESWAEVAEHEVVAVV
ncbi:hypothetical protein KDL01_10985 [Actinospica durhamensis]|uniref:Uncharacterized protein n=1 Tax=Actinospica durhamensis TaxID=1508375 RepID=A0A941ENT6_9ACTN|nr:hypothetical protein [Actinospica durhamensis]MBR7833793.1 hypothetical protein [Actinospica durhamensis]